MVIAESEVVATEQRDLSAVIDIEPVIAPRLRAIDNLAIRSRENKRGTRAVIGIDDKVAFVVRGCDHASDTCLLFFDVCGDTFRINDASVIEVDGDGVILSAESHSEEFGVCAAHGDGARIIDDIIGGSGGCASRAEADGKSGRFCGAAEIDIPPIGDDFTRDRDRLNSICCCVHHSAGVIVRCVDLDDAGDSRVCLATIGGASIQKSDGCGIVDPGRPAAREDSHHGVTILACASLGVLFEGDGAGVIDVDSANPRCGTLGDKNTNHIFGSAIGVFDFNGAFDSAIKVLGIEGEDARQSMDIPRAEVGIKAVTERIAIGVDIGGKRRARRADIDGGIRDGAFGCRGQSTDIGEDAIQHHAAFELLRIGRAVAATDDAGGDATVHRGGRSDKP